MINFKNKTIYGWSKSDFSKCEYLETSNIEIINEIFDFAKKSPYPDSKQAFMGLFKD